MPCAFTPEPTRSLATAESGERMEIRRILFGALRAACARLGVREGAVVRCHAEIDSKLVLETASGRRIALERDWAQFIQVVPAPLDAHRVQAGMTAEPVAL